MVDFACFSPDLFLCFSCHCNKPLYIYKYAFVYMFVCSSYKHVETLLFASPPECQLHEGGDFVFVTIVSSESGTWRHMINICQIIHKCHAFPIYNMRCLVFATVEVLSMPYFSFAELGKLGAGFRRASRFY